MRRTTLVAVLVALSMTACSDDEQAEKRAVVTTTTTATSPITKSDCASEAEKLRSALKARSEERGGLADERTLVQEGFLDQESALYDVTVDEGQVVGGGGQASGASVKAVNPVCGG
jgi:hypothetical protein